MASIIHIIGTSGSGKSSVQEELSKRISGLGYEVVELIEPGPLREITKEYRRRNDKNGLAEAALFSTDRYLLHHDMVFPRLDEPNLVFLSGRGLYDSIVYQGIIGGVPIDTILAMNHTIPLPNLCLCLLVNGDVGHQRAVNRFNNGGDPVTKTEQPNAIEELTAGYRKLPSMFPDVHIIDTTYNDLSAVTNLCYSHIQNLLG